MKKVLKLTLAVVCVMCSTSLFAQKIGRINTQDVIVNMAEFKDAQTQLEAFAKDLQAQAETIQVEFNTKLQEYQKGEATMTDAVKQLKEKELTDLQTRYQEFQQVAQQDMAKKEAELMNPIYEKANDAIKQVSSAGGYVAIFSTTSDQPAAAGLAYFDPVQLTDITPEVKVALGIQ